MKKQQGIVAAGHEITANAAAEILRSGGNAFDAAIGALFASCVAEPVLASLGGGGFLLAHKGGTHPVLFDFFVQTPRNKLPREEVDFYPILADFGTAQQEFHIGTGSIATPGVVKGLFAVHKELCSLPVREIIAPACEAARNGVRINEFQHYISDIVSPIILSNADSLRLHESRELPGQIAPHGSLVHHTEMADAFEALASEGERLFYLGEMGQQMVSTSRQRGGHLTEADLRDYQVIRRQPLTLDYHDAKLFTNPAPSVGGTLIAFTLALLEREELGSHRAGSIEHLERVARAMMLTQQVRRENGIDMDLDEETSRSILTDEYLASYRRTMNSHASFSRGTTQISVADSAGNFASMTLSNGEGSGYVIPHSGIMLNNMLGEEDINPHGFHQWPENRRIASMMSPSLVFAPDGRTMAVGSGGSNRIRSAILQVLVNLLDFHMPMETAVEQPRLHFESGLLNIESGYNQAVIEQLEHEFPEHRLWPDKNLFFGGAHSVMHDRHGRFDGKGDSRRGGICLTV